MLMLRLGLDVNWFIVIAAAVAGMALGFIWYMPQVFGDKWIALSGLKPKNKDEEEAGEYVQERGNIAQGLLAVFRFRNQQPGNECTQGKGKPQAVGKKRRCKGDYDDADHE